MLVIGVAWFLVTGAAGLYLLARGIAAGSTWLGAAPTAAELRAAAAFVFAGSTSFALGLSGLWFVRRNGGWLIGAGAVLVIGLLWSLIYLTS